VDYIPSKVQFQSEAQGKVRNKVDDVLSRWVAILIIFRIEILGFECLKELYAKDVDFQKV
jgi:hypothetical protein